MINLPIFRAKKLDSNEYLEGWYSDTLFLCMGDFQGHFISYKKINVVGKEITLQESIDPKTLSIHFPNMLAKDSNRYLTNGEKDLRMFASLQEDGKGGDILQYKDKYNCCNTSYLFNLIYSKEYNAICVREIDEEKELDFFYELPTFMKEGLKIIGIQQ